MNLRGYTLLNGADPQLRRVVLELRYSRSGAFYSRFGKILDVLAETRPDWFFNPDTKSGLAGNFVCVSSGLDASIGETRITVNLAPKPDLAPYSMDEIHEFAAECDFLADVYTSNVQPAERARIGFRQFYEADFDSEDLADEWVLSLGVVPAAPVLADEFGGKVTNLSFVVVIDNETYRTRLAVETGRKEALLDRGDAVATVRSHMLSKKQRDTLHEAERKSAWVRRRRSASATIDIDSYTEWPTDDVLTGEFIKTHFRTAFTNFSSAVQKANK